MNQSKPIRVLLVEDQEISRTVVTIILSDLNCSVTWAASGFSALELFKKNEYDLVLIDIGLPDLNGLQVAEFIRSYPEEKANVPIVVISAYSSSKYIEKATALGLNDFIIKPISKENCEEVVFKYFHEELKIANQN